MTQPLSGVWTVMVFETRTGRIVANDLTVPGLPRWRRQLNTAGSVDLEILVDDATSAATLRGYLSGWRYSAAVCYGGYIAQAGPILSTRYTDATSTVSVSCGDLWTLLARRLVVSPATPPSPTSAAALLGVDATRDTTYTALALHDIAAHLVSDSCSRTNFALPVDIPADIGGSASRTYPLYELAPVGTRLQDLVQVDGGPDVDFAPYFDPANPGYIRWQMRIGNPALQQLGVSFRWDYGANLTAADVDSDPTGMADGMYVKGSGVDRASLIAYSSNPALPTAGWPALETVDAGHTSETDPAVIQGYADADLGLSARPVETWTATVRADRTPLLGDYAPGSYATFAMAGHSWIPDGLYVQRILGIASDGIGTVQLILHAIQGAL